MPRCTPVFKSLSHRGRSGQSEVRRRQGVLRVDKIEVMAGKPKTYRELARAVLEHEGAPLHYKEITRRVLRLRGSQGATPWETIRAQMAVNPEFVRVAEGVFALAEWDGVREARFAKDIGYDILKERGSPLPARELGLKILEERHFIGSPSLIARNCTRNDPRFFREAGSDTIGLTEWGQG